MARITYDGYDRFGRELEQLSRRETDKICYPALRKGAEILADEIRRRLEALPEEAFRRLAEGEKFEKLPSSQKRDLLESLGITGIGHDYTGKLTIKVGWHDYGWFTTNQYPDGLPNGLLAGAIEHGSSVRQKHPFIRPAVRAKRKQVIEAMSKEIEDYLRTIF